MCKTRFEHADSYNLVQLDEHNQFLKSKYKLFNIHVNENIVYELSKDFLIFHMVHFEPLTFKSELESSKTIGMCVYILHDLKVGCQNH